MAKKLRVGVGLGEAIVNSVWDYDTVDTGNKRIKNTYTDRDRDRMS